MTMFLGKYNTQWSFTFPMIKRGVVDFAVGADWTPATGDVKISQSTGTMVNTTNLPTIVAGTGATSWKLVLTAAEMTADEVDVQIVDSATKVVEDQFLKIETYGNASAKYACNFADIIHLGLTALPNAAAEAAGGLFTRGTGAGQLNQQTNGQLDANVARWLNTAVVTPNTSGVPIVDSRAQVIRQGVAQSGTSSAIVLDTGASSVDNFYTPCLCAIVGGTGLGQAPRVATGYTGSSRSLAIAPAWSVNPASDTVFQLLPAAVSLEAWLRTVPLGLTSQMVQTKADLVTWLGVAPLALTAQRVDTTVGAMQASVITAAAHAANAIDSNAIAASGANKIRDAVSDDIVEVNGPSGPVTRQQAESLMLSALAGVTASGGSVLKDGAGTATRITATIDGSNQRTAMAYNPSA